MQEESWRRNHVGGVVEGIWRQRHPGDTQEAYSSIREAPRRSPGSSPEVPRKHPGGCQGHPEAPEGTRKHPENLGGSQETRRVFDRGCAKTIMFYSENGASNHFRTSRSSVTLTESAACDENWQR